MCSFKTVRNALKQWGEKKYVGRKEKFRLIDIYMKAKQQGEAPQLRANGDVFSVKKLQRFIDDERRATIRKAQPIPQLLNSMQLTSPSCAFNSINQY